MSGASASAAGPDGEREAARSRQLVWAALGEVPDPELGISIVDLGLVYAVVVEDGVVYVAMTRTTPACPLGEPMQREAEAAIRAVLPEHRIDLRIVWEPRWTPHMMTPHGRAALGLPPIVEGAS